MLHDLILLINIPLNVQKTSVKHDLNKAQTKELAKLKQASDKVFHKITQKGTIQFKDQKNPLLPTLSLNDFSVREIQALAQDIEKANIKNQQKINTAQGEFTTQIKIAVMTRLGS